MIRSIFIIVAMILTAGGAAGQVLSLKQYRERVLEYNQDIKKSDEAVKAALYSLKSIRTGFFPKLDGSGNYSYQFESLEFVPGSDLKHDNYGIEAGLVQNVYSGSAVRRQFRAARIEEAIAALGREHTVDNIVYAADVNYWTVAANEDQFRIATDFVKIVNELTEIVTKRFEEGAISRTDVLMVQSRQKETELQLNTSAMNYRTALQSLNIMMGTAIDNPVMLSDSIRAMVLLPKERGIDDALEQRADYQSALQGIVLAREQTYLVRSGYLPQLAVGVKEKWGTTMINLDGSSRFSTIAFANLSIPVFHWGEGRQNIRRSRTQEEVKELERSQLVDQVNKELNAAWVTLAESLKKLEIVNSTLEIARDNLILNTYSYNEGKLPILDVLSAQVTWLQVYTNVVSVNYQCKVALADYIRALGGE